jgi:hypothetical protein
MDQHNVQSSAPASLSYICKLNSLTPFLPTVLPEGHYLAIVKFNVTFGSYNNNPEDTQMGHR